MQSCHVPLPLCVCGEHRLLFGEDADCDALLELDLLVDRMPSGAGCPGGFGGCERGVVSGYRLVGVLGGAQPGGDPGLAGGDGLAVAPTVRAFVPVGAGPLDLAGVGLALVGVRGESEHGDAGRGGYLELGR